MALEEAGAWLNNELTLPINGRKYRVQEPSAELGVRLEILLNSADRDSDRYRQVLSDQEERDLYADLLGDVYQAMVADGVSYPVLKLAAVTAMYHFVLSPEVAEQFWNEGVAGSTGKAGGSSSSSRPATPRTTGAARTTKPRASSSGTRSRKNS